MNLKSRALFGAVLLIAAGLLSGCVLEPGPAYNVSQFHHQTHF